MSNPCECSRRRAKFIMQMRGNFKDSMVIPARLVDHFGGKISGTIRLEAPNGQMYVVGVAKKMNRSVLQSGWEAFVRANQIQDNCYLMFRNLGISCFKVTIFDSNGEERITCRAGAKISAHVKKASTYGADISSSSFDGASDSEGRKSGKAPAVNSSSDESSEDSLSEGESMESDDLQGLSKDYVLAGRCHLTEEQEDEIKEFVAKIRPETPVLVVMMKKTNVNHYPNLVISKDYAHAYFPHKTQVVTLKLPGKSKAWPCKFRIRPDGRGRNLSLREFVHDNCVKKGDLCLFQPMTEVQSTRFTFMVHLLRKVGRTDICSNQGEDSPSEYESTQSDHQETSSEVRYILSRRCRLDEEDEVGIDALIAEIQPEIPLLVVQIMKSNVNGPQPALIIPKRYAAAHFPTESQNIILTLPGVKKKWHPLFHVRRGNIGYVLYGRWLEFVRDNRLREGDICLLQPINRGEGRRFMLMVHLLPKARRAGKSKGGDVVRGSKIGGTSMKAASTACVKDEPVDGASDGCDRPGYVVLGCSARLTQAQERVLAEKVKAVRSEAPIYVAAMDKSNLRSALDLGTTGHAAAADGRLPDGKQTLTLHQAGWSKAWRVEMRHRRMVPAGGWREFAADNRLQAGDLCLLEPVVDKRLAMAVHIIRSEQCR
ncbi:hypothetical protein CFC21_004115 [Triticum aestivum]|uniref:TF-B3 domain-containing protein n=2 Tax=Triticum TaxID=4564 RepID=A0A9R0QF89_TRITD|nr:hypothetical protein CFC21_004115 [Triticum aestivum]VAH10485.1 unnamed protein product [Triticum turgidum subsp. durum]